MPLKLPLNCNHEAEWTPFQIHYFSENLVAPGIDQRGGQSPYYYLIELQVSFYPVAVLLQ
jgi:hypothetical protein